MKVLLLIFALGAYGNRNRRQPELAQFATSSYADIHHILDGFSMLHKVHSPFGAHDAAHNEQVEENWQGEVNNDFAVSMHGRPLAHASTPPAMRVPINPSIAASAFPLTVASEKNRFTDDFSHSHRQGFLERE